MNQTRQYWGDDYFERRFVSVIIVSRPAAAFTVAMKSSFDRAWLASTVTRDTPPGIR